MVDICPQWLIYLWTKGRMFFSIHYVITLAYLVHAIKHGFFLRLAVLDMQDADYEFNLVAELIIKAKRARASRVRAHGSFFILLSLVLFVLCLMRCRLPLVSRPPFLPFSSRCLSLVSPFAVLVVPALCRPCQVFRL